MTDKLNYGSYLQLDKILRAQDALDDDLKPRPYGHHDEHLFIVVHQVYELWFKQILHELVRVRDLLAQDEVPEHLVPTAVKSLRRIQEIWRVLIGQLAVLETMSPMDFLAFREQLGRASGFQSAQFRELEILAGLPDEVRFQYEGSAFEHFFAPEQIAAFERRRAEPSLRDALYRWLDRTPFEDGFVESYLAAFDRYCDAQRALHEANPQLPAERKADALRRLEEYRGSCRTWLGGDDAAVRAACLFITAYREVPLLHWPNRLLDSLLEFEELWRLWRFRHARMVERMIGLRLGTGGSSGVDYLDATAGSRYRVFTVILESRSFLVPRRLLPELKDPQRYGFALGQPE